MIAPQSMPQHDAMGTRDYCKGPQQEITYRDPVEECLDKHHHRIQAMLRTKTTGQSVCISKRYIDVNR